VVVVVVVGRGAVVVVAAGAVEVVVAGGAVVVVVPAAAVVVVVADGTVVVVLPVTQPPGPHASQQLGTDPTHAVPPGGALQKAALLLMEQVVWPVLLVRQQVTAPGLPQDDCAAQDTTEPSHSGRSEPFSTAASTTPSTQFT